MVSKGEIGANDMVEAFRSMSSEGGRFADLMEQQSQTLAGQWSNLQDNLASIGESIGLEVIPAIKELVDKVATWIDENTENLKRAGSEIFTVIKTVSDSAIAVIGVIRDNVNTLMANVGKGANWIADQIAGTMSDADRVTAE